VQAGARTRRTSNRRRSNTEQHAEFAEEDLYTSRASAESGQHRACQLDAERTSAAAGGGKAGGKDSPLAGRWRVELGGKFVPYDGEAQRQLELAWARGDQVGPLLALSLVERRS
jgi:hypothetical protein